MDRYKRNQLEEAISRGLEPHADGPSSELRTRIKRLLEIDRSLGRAVRSADPEKANYAFFSDDAPGSGVEIWFSEYEAFAVLIGLLLMHHGWTLKTAVSILRRVRSDLERQHARILKQDARELFDQDAIKRSAKEGDFAFDNTDPVLLVLVSKPIDATNEQGSLACAVHRGVPSAMAWASKVSGNRGGWSTFELVTAVHKLSKHLKNTEPASRGRRS